MNRFWLLMVYWISSGVFAEDFLVGQDTFFKKTTAQASSLSTNDKCLVNHVTLLSASSVSSENGHFKIVLENNLPNCPLTTGYFYQDHVSRESNLITITAQSVFKKKRLDSAMLKADEKCDILPGVYATVWPVASVVEGHYYLTLKKPLASCAFTLGYLWEGHTQKGSLAIQITQPTFFKKSPLQSSDLPSSDICNMPVAVYPLRVDAIAVEPTHYKISLSQSLAGCGFNTGYVYFDHTNWQKPASPPPVNTPNYQFPMPNGYYTSGWCVCRNIGTSPHIGQDIAKSGSQYAVAVEQGIVSNTTYSSSCGYITYVKDNWGTNWRYVHLNKPSVGNGSRVKAGQHLANISQYPLSGCGSGPHLHFERRTAGYFADSPAGKTCQYGYTSCNFDPIKPWRSSSRSVQDLLTPSRKKANWAESEIDEQSQCKVAVNRLNEVARQRLEQFPLFNDPDLHVEFSISDRTDQESVFDASVYLNDNQQNLCDNQRCIVKWQLVSEAIDGKLTNIFYHNRVRNTPLIREKEESLCLPDNQVSYWLLLKDNQGKQWRAKANRL